MPSNIFVPEKTFRALDDDAFDAPSGSIALDAMVLRDVCRSNNHLLLDGHMLFNLIWPTESSGEEGIDTTYFAFTPVDMLLADHLEVPKKPYLRQGTLKIRHRVDSSQTVYYGVGTLNNPIPPPPWRTSDFPSTNVVSATGTDDWATVSLDNIPLDPGFTEEISVARWVVGTGAVETDTSTYGNPLTNPFECNRWVPSYVGGTSTPMPIGVVRDSATWNNALALGEHAIEFTDSSGNPILGERFPIVWVNNGNELYFSKHVSAMAIQEIIWQSGLSESGTNNSFCHIVKLPKVEIACATMIAKEVSASAV